jgi:hypothetical protein
MRHCGSTRPICPISDGRPIGSCAHATHNMQHATYGTPHTTTALGWPEADRARTRQDMARPDAVEAVEAGWASPLLHGKRVHGCERSGGPCAYTAHKSLIVARAQLRE